MDPGLQGKLSPAHITHESWTCHPVAERGQARERQAGCRAVCTGFKGELSGQVQGPVLRPLASLHRPLPPRCTPREVGETAKPTQGLPGGASRPKPSGISVPPFHQLATEKWSHPSGPVPLSWGAPSPGLGDSRLPRSLRLLAQAPLLVLPAAPGADSTVSQSLRVSFPTAADLCDSGFHNKPQALDPGASSPPAPAQPHTHSRFLWSKCGVPPGSPTPHSTPLSEPGSLCSVGKGQGSGPL